MAQELTFNISEDRRKLQGPVEAKNFNLKFGTDGSAITHGKPDQWVQGRIGDDQLKQVFVNITEGEGNTPKDVAGMFLAFVGIIHDKDGRPHRVVDYKHSTTIDVEHGRFRFDFPDQAFTVAGEYQQAFFMLVKEGPGGGCVATMEFDMQVMANFVFTDLVPEDYITPFNDTVDQLLAACKKFKDDTAADEAKFKQELEDAYAKFQKDTNTQFSNFKDATDDDLAKFKKANADDIANFKQQYADAVKAKQDELQKIVDNYTDKIDTMLKDLNQQGIDTSTMLTDLRSQMAALKDKINSEHLFTEDEAKQFEDQINNRLTELQKAVTDAQTDIQNIKESLSSAGFMVNDYGAKADGETDDTSAIQKAIDAFAKSKLNRLVFSGTYKVSKTDIDDDKRPYAVKFAGLSHKTIDLTNAQFKVDMVDNFPSVLAFYNCTDIYVVGGYAEAVNFNMTQQHDLYSGAFVYAHGCTNLSVYHTSTFDMMYNTCIFESSDGVISGTKFNHDLSSKEWKLRPCSAVLLYDGAKYHVQDNIIYGGLRDGDLSIFGGKTYGNTVTNNYLQALNYFSEGITVDGGACKTIVSNNILNSYNYAIDIKFNSENTLVNGNTIEKSTVAISDRGGEINSKAHVFQTIIANNNIVFGDLPESEQPELGKLGLNNFHQVGINIDKEFTADIHGNHLTLGRDYDVNYKIVGIMVNAQAGEGQPDFVSPINIIDNFLELKNGIDGFYQEAGDGSSCIYLNAVRQGNISNNSIKSDKNNSYVDIVGNNGTLTFNGNSFTSSSSVPIKYGDGATCNHLIINNNNLMEGFVEITNAPKYQVGTQYNNKQYVAKNIDFTNNTTTPFLIISSIFSRSVLLKVDMTYDYNGTFVVSSVYRLYIDTNPTRKEGDYTSLEAITQNDKDTELSIVRIDRNSIGLQAKPTRENYETAVATFHITILDNATDVWFN